MTEKEQVYSMFQKRKTKLYRKADISGQQQLMNRNLKVMRAWNDVFQAHKNNIYQLKNYYVHHDYWS